MKKEKKQARFFRSLVRVIGMFILFCALATLAWCGFTLLKSVFSKIWYFITDGSLIVRSIIVFILLCVCLSTEDYILGILLMLLGIPLLIDYGTIIFGFIEKLFTILKYIVIFFVGFCMFVLLKLMGNLD